jgi:hypothetical protein
VADPNGPDPTEADEDVDPGPPLALLADLGVAPQVGFFDRVWNGIERLQLGGSFLELIWHIPFVVLREVLEVLSGFLGEARGGKGEPD